MSETKKMMQKIIAIILVVNMTLSQFTPVFSMGVKQAENSTADITITTKEDYINFVIRSQKEDFKGQTIVLVNDISLEDLTLEEINTYIKEHFPQYGEDYEMSHLTIGNNKQAFSGTFDGQGHTISGLNYVKFFFPSPNSGLFAWTEGATIKNLTVLNAQICCIYQGGIIVGYANDTIIENISVIDSDLNIKTANNIVSLITNGGFTGGAIVGYSVNSTLYNCEIAGTRVHNTVVEAVAGVGGDAMYMGGLVGLAENSDIIYCRARTTYKDEGNPIIYENDDGRYTTEDGRRMSYVSNVHNVAIGALGGKQLFAGGIAGGAKGANFYDCYCTAEVSFYAATYVSVGAGIVGFGGGITGKLKNGRIERCSFAGDIYSTQYNAVLVIPIIQPNVHISGIVEYVKGNNVIEDSYFRLSDIKSGYQPYAVGSQYDCEESKVLSDDLYKDVNFWEDRDFDFIGNQKRNISQKDFYNKWVMDYELGIPVHGHSVAATFDFPNAAGVSIDATMLTHKKVATDSCYDFAVQGLHPKTDQTIKVDIHLNNSYRFEGWHQKAMVQKHHVETTDLLREITSTKPVATEHSATIGVKDNDLVVAAVEGKVSYHDVEGKIIKEQWHRYKTNLVEPPLDDLGEAQFYGWTTLSNDGKGYKAITSDKLATIKRQGEYYQNEDLVRKTMDLYPIYIDATANVQIEIEGHDEDTPAIRTGLGKAQVKKAGDELYIDVDYDGGQIPAGYRFKGWYKEIDGGEICVSRQEKFKIADISQEVRYIARYQYQVSYWVKTYHQDGLDKESYKYKDIWHNYKDQLIKLEEPSYLDETIIHWGTKHQNHKTEDEACLDNLTESKITGPKDVYSHNYSENKGNKLSVYADSDFPDAGKITTSIDEGRTFTYTTFDRYQFKFWTLERENLGRAWTYEDNVMDVGKLNSTKIYKARAMVTTTIYFHQTDGGKQEILRRYQDPVLLEQEKTYDYTYPHYYKDRLVDEITYDTEREIQTSVTSPASPSNESMQREGYQFLGWLSSSEVATDSFIWNYLYNTEEKYCTQNIERITPYLVTAKDLVTATIDLYPVYAKYDITTTTNIEPVQLPESINKPKKPTYTLAPIEGKPNYRTITLTAEDNQTTVFKTNTKDNRTYRLVRVLCEVDGETTILELEKEENEYSYTGEVKAGKSYTFTSIYSPLFAIFNLDDDAKQQVIVRNYGEPLGIDIEPDYQHISNIEKSCFVGWTDEKRDSYKFASKADYDASQLADTLVTRDTVMQRNLVLDPIFVKGNITVQSNIDQIIQNDGKNPNDYRWIEPSQKGTLTVKAKEYPGYKFSGWVTKDKEVSKELTHHVTNVFSDQQYTAIYEKAWTIRYHDLAGNTIYTTSVVNESRSFVEKNGTQEYFIDKDAVLKIIEKLTGNQHFVEWVWKSGPNSITWLDFKDKKITQNMDIYPKIMEVTASHNEKFYTDNIQFGLTQDTEGNLLTGLFKEDYQQSAITLTVLEKTYQNTQVIQQLNTKMYAYDLTDTNDSETAQPEDKLSELNPEQPIDNQEDDVTIASDQQAKDQTIIEVSQGSVPTDKNGQATHHFYGRVDITVSAPDASDTYLVYLEQASEGEGSFNDCNIIPIHLTQDGEQKSGTTTVKLPLGSYTISDNTKWNWRNHTETSADEVRYPVTLSLQKRAKITIDKTDYTNKWFSGYHNWQLNKQKGSDCHDEA
ncbi:repeat domain (List_Bact_rpt) [Granulicatella balaenopterae]|uniref:Repeat domain (List_Bact_rpt) n=1 Tax=Granulicatella balaenopterae TaxID=137733 RepID=A0A1H9LFQ1_9LACT|nr:right-handed parallel beta-helix repeat-containing protein [Granulicatella balaenopterae]SER10198.1 repeat domain (List_Bact_rpt) [Granulicatella balaenopterae]